MAVVYRTDIGKDILEAMGIDYHNVSELNIRIAVGNVVEATITRFVDGHEMDALAGEVKTLMEEYRMVAQEPASEESA